VVSLVVAGLLAFWVTPTIQDSYECRSDWSGLVLLGGLLTGAIGVVVSGGNLQRARNTRSWPVVLAGVALILCGIAAFYLYVKTEGSYRCEPS
jgi:hypothetical protein